MAMPAVLMMFMFSRMKRVVRMKRRAKGVLKRRAEILLRYSLLRYSVLFPVEFVPPPTTYPSHVTGTRALVPDAP